MEENIGSSNQDEPADRNNVTGENDIDDQPTGWNIHAATLKGLKRFPNVGTQAKKERDEFEREKSMNSLATVDILPKPKWLTIEQLLQILPLKKSRIYYMTHIGAIPHHKIGQTLLFREDEILQWMEGNKVKP